MTENTENPEYLSSKIEMMSSLKNLPDLGSLLMDLFHFIVFLLAFIIPLNMGMKRGGGTDGHILKFCFKLNYQTKKNELF